MPGLGEALGVLLRCWRQDAGMTQAQLAAELGSFREVVGRLERGGAGVPSLRTLQVHAKATGGDLRQAFELVDRWYGISPAVNLRGDPTV
jgi:transcriptional regulator with XRE-family HTH domain